MYYSNGVIARCQWTGSAWISSFQYTCQTTSLRQGHGCSTVNFNFEIIPNNSSQSCAVVPNGWALYTQMSRQVTTFVLIPDSAAHKMRSFAFAAVVCMTLVVASAVVSSLTLKQTLNIILSSLLIYFHIILIHNVWCYVKSKNCFFTLKYYHCKYKKILYFKVK